MTWPPRVPSARCATWPAASAASSAGRCRGQRPGPLLSALRRELTWPGHPTVLVIEDVHWADDATLDALRYLVRRIAELPAVLVLTYRDDELSRGHPLYGLLGLASRSDQVRHLPLRRLSPDAVRALTAGSPVSAAELYALTAGQPVLRAASCWPRCRGAGPAHHRRRGAGPGAPPGPRHPGRARAAGRAAVGGGALAAGRAGARRGGGDRAGRGRGTRAADRVHRGRSPSGTS